MQKKRLEQQACQKDPKEREPMALLLPGTGSEETPRKVLLVSADVAEIESDTRRERKRPGKRGEKPTRMFRPLPVGSGLSRKLDPHLKEQQERRTTKPERPVLLQCLHSTQKAPYKQDSTSEGCRRCLSLYVHLRETTHSDSDEYEGDGSPCSTQNVGSDARKTKNPPYTIIESSQHRKAASIPEQNPAWNTDQSFSSTSSVETRRPRNSKEGTTGLLQKTYVVTRTRDELHLLHPLVNLPLLIKMTAAPGRKRLRSALSADD